MRISTLAAVVAFPSFTLMAMARVENRHALNPFLDACPADCHGKTRSSWSAYRNVKHLNACDRHMMIDFAPQNALDDPSTTVKMLACTVHEAEYHGNDVSSSLLRRGSRDSSTSSSTLITANANVSLCVDDANPIDVSLDVAIAGDGSSLTWAAADTLAGVSTYMSADCDLKQTFSYKQGAIVGVYSGAAVDNAGTVSRVLAEAIAIANNSQTGAPETMFLQRCVQECSSKHIFGVAMNNAGNLSWVQQAAQSWSNGICLNASSLALAETSTIANITFYEYTHPNVVLKNITSIGNHSMESSSTVCTRNSLLSGTTTTLVVTMQATSTLTSLIPSGTSTTPPGPTRTGITSTCNRYKVAVSGEECRDFASAYNITLDELYAWNPAVGQCANFWSGEAYCVGVSSSAKPQNKPMDSQWPESNLLGRRGHCSTVTIAAGDSCGSLAAECGITAAAFTTYNPDRNLCSTLAPGKRVCCSAGTLPDVTPKENADGSCYAYTVQSNDTCSVIAAKYDLTIANVDDFNSGTTWGWFGCNHLPVDLNICLSPGSPPMPSAVANALCGPTVPGTEMPTNSTPLSDLNQCPLNACCNIWGQCGITPEYCTNTTGASGNPGTAPPSENGCISNCGTEITNDEVVAEDFISRHRSRLRITHTSTGHWAFATISDDYDVVINDTYSQWDDFKALSMKRIVSLGGWGYSTGAATYDRLRQAMNDDNRLTFVNNIIRFLNDQDIDGVDFDWEYPGATDLPGIPAGLPSDGPNYFTFLSDLRGKMGLNTTKTISFAAPASYWYLQHFPISKMAAEADYVVYMTYDLHGQWDHGNVWSQDGCSGGNCLRSHINITETMYTLAMITKAGVPTYKITVGVSSYGRSFGMTRAGCTGPECTFGGSPTESTAAVGECTLTAGYISNAEILEIILGNDTSLAIRSWYDKGTDSNYLVYNETNWVAYMTDDVRMGRMAKYQGLNFAGTIDWAVDLAYFGDDEGTPDGDCTGCYDTQPPQDPWTVCDSDPVASIDDLSDDVIAGWPVHCRAQYILEALAVLLTESMSNFTDLIADDYDKKFQVYAKAVADNASHQVHDFLLAHGNDYFTCEVVELQMCCDYCRADPVNNCAYCFDGTCYSNNRRNDGFFSIDEGDNARHPGRQVPTKRDYIPHDNKHLITKSENISQPCPPDYSKRGYGPNNPYEQTMYWTLRSEKAADFYADILDSTGILKDKIGFGLYTDVDFCGGTGAQVGDGNDCWNSGYEFGAPFPNGYGTADVTNPKDLAQKGLTNSASLPGQIMNVVNSLKAISYPGNAFQVVDAVSLPIMMIAEGVESMSLVIQTADKIDEEERKALILGFVGAILFFVPIAGEVVGTVVELADITSIIAVMGTAANAAFDIYTIVKDPDNAPLAIVDLIMAPLALADVAIIARAANIRRGMSADDLAKLGNRIGERMSKIEKVTGVCHKG